MKMTFEQSKKHDAARIVGTYLDVKSKFFQHHQFLVLPFLKHKCVYLPDFNYSPLAKIKTTPTYHARGYKTKDLKFLTKELETFPYPERISQTRIKKEFSSIKKEVDKKIKLLFPKLLKKVNKIRVIVTPFGTDGSFDYKKKGKKYDPYLWIRNSGCTFDQLLAHLIHVYISSFVLIATNIPDSKTEQWKSREAIVDFLMTYTFSTFVKKTPSKTLPFIESNQRSQTLVDASDKYLNKLNGKLKAPSVSIKKGEYYINNKKIALSSKKESALFFLLLKQKNKFVTKDEILSVLYKDFDGSDWSVSKNIERLRKKIVAAGVSFPLIKTSRNIGYKLISK